MKKAQGGWTRWALTALQITPAVSLLPPSMSSVRTAFRAVQWRRSPLNPNRPANGIPLAGHSGGFYGS